MPGFFGVRERSSRDSLFENWIETTCTRDLAQFGIPRFNPDLARRIFFAIAKLSKPNPTEIARSVGKLPRQIEPYLQAFKSLFVVYEIPPSVMSTGKSLYYLFDAGMAHYAGSDDKRCLQIWFLNECFSRYSYAGLSRPDIFYYESTKGSRMDFLVDSKDSSFAVLLCREEAPPTYTLRSAFAFRKKHPNVSVFVCAPCVEKHKIENGIQMVPWTQVFDI
jgi:predicted AAA+ superfamily ATPase